MELETHLLVIARLSYIPVSEIEPILMLAAEVSQMLAGLTKKLKDLTPGT